MPWENEAASFTNKVLRKAIDLGVDAALAAMATQAPWIKLPIISQVTKFILGHVGDYLYRFLAEHSTFIIIDFQTAIEKQAYLQSVDKLKAAMSAGDENEAAKAREEFKRRLADLIHYSGHAHP
jgi:hypothetical protein